MQVPKWLILLFAILSLIGFADATYLSFKHYSGEPPVCSLLGGCDVVTTSVYATVGPIPIAVMGALYYLTLFLLVVAAIDTRRDSFLRWACHLTIIGVLVSSWLLFVQFGLLRAVCLYCLGSAATSLMLFILSRFMLRYRPQFT